MDFLSSFSTQSLVKNLRKYTHFTHAEEENITLKMYDWIRQTEEDNLLTHVHQNLDNFQKSGWKKRVDEIVLYLRNKGELRLPLYKDMFQPDEIAEVVIDLSTASTSFLTDLINVSVKETHKLKRTDLAIRFTDVKLVLPYGELNIDVFYFWLHFPILPNSLTNTDYGVKPMHLSCEQFLEKLKEKKFYLGSFFLHISRIIPVLMRQERIDSILQGDNASSYADEMLTNLRLIVELYKTTYNISDTFEKMAYELVDTLASSFSRIRANAVVPNDTVVLLEQLSQKIPGIHCYPKGVVIERAEDFDTRRGRPVAVINNKNGKYIRTTKRSSVFTQHELALRLMK